jgi:lipopolysaccharide/colanic/teichoic acid biosynthesis glycosyltransferase
MKRSFDILLTLITAPLWVPLLTGVACVVVAGLGFPIFFIQERLGLNEVPFRLIKFRTMRLGDAPDADRLTRLGRFLRATSLDELPELLNVLKGEMSLVGPRPLLLRYLPRYTPEQRRRHTVRPGLTGWAQVNGRNALTWEEKFAYDRWYVTHQSFALDLKILGLTLWRVVTRQGINANNEATMGEFRGDT